MSTPYDDDFPPAGEYHDYDDAEPVEEELPTEPVPGEADDSPMPGAIYRGSANDLYFGLLIAGAISLGLIPLIDSSAVDLRYTIVWGILAAIGVTSWLIGSGPQIGQERPENLAWGIAFGFILGVPLLAFGGANFSEAANLLFRDLGIGTVLAYMVFVMPLAETLFFRGLLQQNGAFWAIALLASLWNLVLFFPLINRGPYPLIIGVVVLMANLMYGYIRDRNGLAATWLCQITVNLLVFFIPFIG